MSTATRARLIRLSLLISIFLATLSPSVATAQAHQPDSAGPGTVAKTGEQVVIRAEDQWQFAEHYFQSAQWASAATEFERFIHYFPEDPRTVTAHFRIGSALLNQNQPQAAREQFQQVVLHPQAPTNMTFQALFRIGDCLARSDSAAQAADHISRVAEMTDDPRIKAEALYRSGWLFLDIQDIGRAQPYFQQIDPDQRFRLGVDPLLAALSEHGSQPGKSPALAGSLALLPGVGYLYLERYQDAAISFLVVGGVLWASYEAFDNDSPVLGSLLGITGAGFYLGNIYGSASSARKANQRQTRRFLDELKNMKVQLSAHPTRPQAGIILSGQF